MLECECERGSTRQQVPVALSLPHGCARALMSVPHMLANVVPPPLTVSCVLRAYACPPNPPFLRPVLDRCSAARETDFKKDPTATPEWAAATSKYLKFQGCNPIRGVE